MPAKAGNPVQNNFAICERTMRAKDYWVLRLRGGRHAEMWSLNLR
jgi:hypothetical protein